MRIIKPYGRSHTERDATAFKRVLRRRRDPATGADPDKPVDIEKFALIHDELVIAQWISAIDKIAAKPSGNDGATDEQRAFRERLGNAAWTQIEKKALLPGLQDAATRSHLVKVWKAKIAPYGTTPYRPRRGRPGKPPPSSPSARGRWYSRFAGDVETTAADADAIAAEIYEHLYVAERRFSADARNRRSGRMPARARSISGNVLRPAKHANTGWSEADCVAFAAAGNVAGEIRNAAVQRENGEDGARTRRVSLDIAGAALFRHYARLFPGDDGKPLSIGAARDGTPGLFNLHMAVKDCYTRILKHHRKDAREHGDRRRKVSLLLPQGMDALFALIEANAENRDLNALVRLGKIIHYEASGDREDAPADPVDNWPTDIADSPFWTSEGQARIKRNEAFVRVWRHVLALAARTVTDWGDPDGHIGGDILLADPIRRATGDLFKPEIHVRKIELLFGRRGESFKGTDDEAFQKDVLKLALQGVAALRHGAFHFKGLGGFARAVAEAGDGASEHVLAAVRALWETDSGDRANQLLKTLRGVDAEYFLDEPQGCALFSALSDFAPGTLPLPRFARVLRRAESAWEKIENGPRLPSPANRADLENPARRCQYTALKLLYERPFRDWLQTRDAAALNAFIDRAVARTTQAARDLNAKGDEENRELIVARAAGLGRLAETGSVEAFFFDLSAETASEMRVQRGYDSDPDNAREQAAYIEDLKCDVVALAYDEYLKCEGFEFLVDISADTGKPTERRFDLDSLPLSRAIEQTESWQTVLYFLIHLVPVDEIGRLLHQIRKWEILAAGSLDSGAEEATKIRARQIEAVLELYLDMHDAKFEGGTALTGVEPFKALFESDDLFDLIFPSQPDSEEDDRIPKRGLREIMRFGNLPTLMPLFAKQSIGTDEVTAFFRAERADDGKSEIGVWQDRRENLHEKWAREKRNFSGDDLQAYVEALTAVVGHRHLAAHVMLTNHVRLHRLLMTVLGRLVDFSGLWERDLYFVTLALTHRAGCDPAQIFDKGGLKWLRRGQIVFALREISSTHEARTVANELARYFGAGFLKGDGAVGIRNGFAHFNMLKRAAPSVDLTGCVNDARRLMAYDRKLKNAVSQSVTEILGREGLVLQWRMDDNHQLGAATITARQARHLGKLQLAEKQQPGKSDRRPKAHPITENLHGKRFVAMAASLFAGVAASSTAKSVTELSLNEIDWNLKSERTRNGREKNRRGGEKKGGRPRGNRNRNRKKSP